LGNNYKLSFEEKWRRRKTYRRRIRRPICCSFYRAELQEPSYLQRFIRWFD